MNFKTLLNISFLLVVVQLFVFWLCDAVIGVNKLHIIKWNWSIMMATLVLAQPLVIAHNIQIGNISKIYKIKYLGAVLFVISFVAAFALMIAISWFSYLCYTHPELIKFQ